jgi:hypothetical protein
MFEPLDWIPARPPDATTELRGRCVTLRRWPPVRAGFETWLAEENFDSGGAQRRKLGELIAQAEAHLAHEPLGNA